MAYSPQPQNDAYCLRLNFNIWILGYYLTMLSSFIFIFSKNADIAVAPLTVTESREKVIDFMMPYMYFTEDMLIRKETSKEEVDYLQFMNPFENAVWFCTLATLVIISIAVFVINYFSPYGYKQEDGKGTSEEFNYFNSLWFSVACMLQQGGDNTPRSLSGKLKISSLLLQLLRKSKNL